MTRLLTSMKSGGWCSRRGGPSALSTDLNTRGRKMRRCLPPFQFPPLPLSPLLSLIVDHVLRRRTVLQTSILPTRYLRPHCAYAYPNLTYLCARRRWW